MTGRPGIASRFRIGRLQAIALLLALGAGLKTVEGVGGAFAQIPDRPAGAVTAADPAAPAAQAAPEGGGGAEALRADLLVELRQRELSLAAREGELDARHAELAAIEARIAQQIAALETAERELSATMALADRAAETDLARLTSVFEAMRPEHAAQVVAEMAPEFAAGLIARLPPATAAAIMAGLEPRLAYGLAAIVAGRNVDVPRR